jgi:hypothetical protein
MTPAILGFQWASWYAVLIAVAVGITTIGGAAVFLIGGAKSIGETLRPTNPLVSFGHPHEAGGSFYAEMSLDPKDREEKEERFERERIANLRVSYVIENKDTVPLRELTTGIRTRDGTEHTFNEHLVQILEARTSTEVANVTVPQELHEGMTERDRAPNFLYWARFKRDGRRWEVLYDPSTRHPSYRHLRRGD